MRIATLVSRFAHVGTCSVRAELSPRAAGEASGLDDAQNLFHDPQLREQLGWIDLTGCDFPLGDIVD